MAKVILILIFFVHMFHTHALPAENHLRVQSQIASNEGSKRFEEIILQIANRLNLAFNSSEISKAESMLSQKVEKLKLEYKLRYSDFYLLVWQAARLLRKYEDFKTKFISQDEKKVIIELKPLHEKRDNKVILGPQNLISRRKYRRFAYNSGLYANALNKGEVKEGSAEFKYGMELAFRLEDAVKEAGYLPANYLNPGSSNKVTRAFILYAVFPEILEISKNSPKLYAEFSENLIELFQKAKEIPYHTISSKDHKFNRAENNPTLETYLVPIDTDKTVLKIINATQKIKEIKEQGKDFNVFVEVEKEKKKSTDSHSYRQNYLLYQSFNINLVTIEIDDLRVKDTKRTDI